MINKTDLKILQIEKQIKNLQEQKNLLGLLKFWHYSQNFRKYKKVKSISLFLNKEILFLEYTKESKTYTQAAFDAFKRDVKWWCETVEIIDFKNPVIFNHQYTKRIFLNSVCPSHLASLYDEA